MHHTLMEVHSLNYKKHCIDFHVCLYRVVVCVVLVSKAIEVHEAFLYVLK